MSYHNSLAPIGLIFGALLMIGGFGVPKFINTAPNNIERINVNAGDIFYISLMKPSIEDYDWEIEYNKEYARLINKRNITPMSSSIGGFRSRNVFQFQGLEHGIIYIICTYPLVNSEDMNTSKIFEITIK